MQDFSNRIYNVAYILVTIDFIMGYNYFKITNPIDRILVHPKSGEVYISDKNVITHLTSNLTLINVHKITSDSSDYTILFLLNGDNNVTACGFPNNSSCVDTNSSGNKKTDFKCLILNNRQVLKDIPEEMIFEHSVSNELKYYWMQEMNYKKPEVCYNCLQNTGRQYIFGFVYEKEYYFLTLDEKFENSLKYPSFISTFNRTGGTSQYISVEIPLLCYVENKLFDKILAAAVDLSDAEGRSIESYIYVSFAQSHENFDDVQESIVCIYQLGNLKKVFGQEGLDRNKKIADGDIVTKHTGEKCNKTRKVEKRNGNFTFSENSINGNCIGKFDGHITSIAIFHQNEKILGLLGTSTGEVIKIYVSKFSLNRASSGYEELTRINLGHNTSVNKENAFSVDKKEVYFVTGNQIFQIPTASCSLYNNCNSCLTTKFEPLSCGWCVNRCAVYSECKHKMDFQKSVCPPYIYNIHPTSGPINGGTNITIEGDYFGLSKITVTIGKADCLLMVKGMKRLICKTTAVTTPRIGLVSVEVEDVTEKYYQIHIIGKTSFYLKSFVFEKPELINFSPAFGPFSGGTNITITGKHLNTGLNKNVTIAEKSCNIYLISSTLIKCTTQALTLESNVDTKSMSYNLKVCIDDATIFVLRNGTAKRFIYKQDPIVQRISTNKSIISGGDIVTVHGQNLDSVFKIGMAVESVIPLISEEVKFSTHCKLINSTVIQCPTPDLTSLPFKPSAKIPLETKLTFLMDKIVHLWKTDSNETFIFYYPNPEYQKFEDDEFISLDQEYLVIMGKHLNLVHSSHNIKVFIKDEPCIVQDLEENRLTCKISWELLSPLNYSKLKVKVISGNLTFFLGHIQLKEFVTSDLISMVLYTPLIFLLLVQLLLLIGILRRWKLSKARNRAIMQNETSIEVFNLITYNENQMSASTIPNNDTAVEITESENAVLFSPIVNCSEEVKERLKNENIILPVHLLKIENIIGEGHFGCVYHGLLENNGCEIDVAVKTMNKNHSEECDVDTFIKEGLMMKNFNHPNVLNLIGISILDDGIPVFVIPFMKHGDLLSYIRNEQNHPKVKDLLTFGTAIASGMEYLSDHHFIHRDLAARNCVLNENLQLKITDFGLSRDVDRTAYYTSGNSKIKVPLRWMALESIESGIYSVKTDVWSFGVVLWELMTRGYCPYPDLHSWELKEHLKMGTRLPQPVYCPDLIYCLMHRCWEKDPHKRPVFSEIGTELKIIIQNLEKRDRRRKLGFEEPYANSLPGSIIDQPSTSSLQDADNNT